jgi:hypothetical protein
MGRRALFLARTIPQMLPSFGKYSETHVSLVLSGTGFSLWGFVHATTKPHRLKRVLLRANPHTTQVSQATQIYFLCFGNGRSNIADCKGLRNKG